MTNTHDVDVAREWLREHCHRAEVRHVLMRALEYAEAVESAGLCPEMNDGESLYQFLTDPATAAARQHAFVAATL
jgi:NifB/MoaA-like Fe-S oxidoreductase